MTSNNKNSITFTAVGDISLGDHPLCAGIGTHSFLRNQPADFPFKHVQAVFDKADVLFGNLECTLSESGIDHSNYHSVQMRGQPNYINSLVNAGFDVLNHANNHSMQHGKEAFRETVALLEKNKIQTCGVNFENHLQGIPRIVEKQGQKLAFLGYSLRPRQYFEYPPLYTEGTSEGINNDVQNIKEEVDFVIVSLHWGDEFIETPSPEDIQLAREIIDSGADLIIGHHPHVLRGIEEYNGGCIVYSLGNFICDMSWDNTLQQTMIFSCKLNSDGITNIEIIPAYINNSFQPELLTGTERNKQLEKISKLSKEVSDNRLNDFSSQLSAYTQAADDILRVIRKKSHRFFIKRIWNYPKIILLQQLLTYFKNRLHEFTH